MKKTRRVAIMLDLDQGFKRHTDVFAGTQRFANQHGNWQCIIDEFADHRLQAGGKRRSSSHKQGQVSYDGIIARASKRLAERANDSGIPLVNVWINTPAKDVVSVFPDMEAEGRIAAGHLIDRGLRSFACLRAINDKSHDASEKGFVDCLHEAGFECGVSTPFENRKPEAPDQWVRLERTFTECIDSWKPPIGVFLLVYDHARILVQMCAERGLRVPEDVALIVNNNEPQVCENPPPSLSSIELGYERVGYEAAALLERLMDENEKGTQLSSAGKRTASPFPAASEKPILIPPAGLIVRQSTDFFAVDDELVAEALRFIASNVAKPIGVKDVVEAVFTSRSTLQNRFREHLDRSILAEITRLRIECAKRHLTESKRRISDIAMEVGFGTQNRMNEAFRRELGMTPSEYRKTHLR